MTDPLVIDPQACLTALDKPLRSASHGRRTKPGYQPLHDADRGRRERMSDRYKLVIEQPAGVGKKGPQTAEGSLEFVVAALRQWSQFPQYGVESVELRRV